MGVYSFFRSLQFWAWVSFVAAALSFLLIWQKSDTSEDSRALLALLREQIAADTVAVKMYLSFLQDEPGRREDQKNPLREKIAASPFLIEIFRGDTLLYWNEATFPAESQGRIRRMYQLDQGFYTGIIRWTGMPSGGKWDHYSHILEAKPEEIPLTTSDLGQAQISLVAREAEEVRRLKSVLWVCCMLFSVLVSVLLGKRCIQQPGTTSFLGIFGWLIFVKAVFYIPAIEAFFEGLVMTRDCFTDAVLVPDITHFFLTIWAGAVIIYLLSRHSGELRRLSIRAGGRRTGLVTGVYTSWIFSACLHLIASFTLQPSVRLDSETLMQFSGLEFIFVILFSLLMLLVFQSTHQLHSLLSASRLTFSERLLWQGMGWMAVVGIQVFAGVAVGPLAVLTLFIAAYSLMMDAYCENREKKISYLIWWLILFSGFEAVSLFYYSLQKDVAVRQELPALLSARANMPYVKEMETRLDSLTQRGIFQTISSLETSARLDRNDLTEFIFQSPADSVESRGTSVELFNKKTGTTLFHNHFADFYKINQSFEQSAAAGQSVYHNPFEDRYYQRFEIVKEADSTRGEQDAQSTSWYLFVIQEGPGASAIRKQRQQLHSFGYACFSRGELILKKENGETPPDPSLLVSVDKTSIEQGFSFVVQLLSPQYKVVSWKRISGLITPISIFSYLFTLSGILLILLAIINTRIPFLPENISMRFGDKSSLKTRIQLAVIVLIVVTFFVIGAITAYYFQNLIQAGQQSRYSNESTAIANHIRSDIQHFSDEENALAFLRSKLKDLASVHEKELTLYDQSGRITGTTRKEGVMWLVPYHLVHGSQPGISPGDTDRKNADISHFVPLVIGSNRPFAYVAIHHLASDISSGSILNFLSTILNAYIFLFLIAGAIAITMANSITQPLTILAEKLKKFKLGKTNERLEWKSQDEIGALITDYNNLTQELERSAGLLAKTERDMAWREMAKQVAHEIKNPLTPMKLSIQYLERASREQPEKAQEMIPRISSTLIEQIDNLSQIANEFSNFATMPQATNEKVVLNEIIEIIHDLFRKRDDMDINMIEPIDDLTVFADKHHLVRILNNLLKNAIQAIPEDRRGKIELELKREGNDAIIRVTDNGTGIPDHMREKVFTPNFTTKNSGTGLGLAISANMIESFNGKIYFDTRPGKGTDFYVRIPLMRLEENRTDGNRVDLDEY